MNKTIILPKRIEVIDSVSKLDVYTIDGEGISAVIDSNSIEPLKMLTYILNKKGITFNLKYRGNQYEFIEEIVVFGNNGKLVKAALNEILEYRCSTELRDEMKWLIRQLPFDIAMRTSDNIINCDIIEELKVKNLPLSRIDWVTYSGIMAQFPDVELGTEFANTDIKQLKKHLIYKSYNGGYNIKTKGYSDSSLEHYSFDKAKRH